MGGQACVLYGAAEYSRDLDLAVLATSDAFPKLRRALDELSATVIAVPSFEMAYLERGHAVHFNVPDGANAAFRVDIMSRMRNVDSFPLLWERRTTVMLPDATGNEHSVHLLSLEDLVAAKKTQRDKDWPMLRRLVDASYVAARDDAVSNERVSFWLSELRSPEFLIEVAARFPDAAQVATRPAVVEVLRGGDVRGALNAEQQHELSVDREYWAPLRRELEWLRHAQRKG